MSATLSSAPSFPAFQAANTAWKAAKQANGGNHPTTKAAAIEALKKRIVCKKELGIPLGFGDRHFA